MIARSATGDSAAFACVVVGGAPARCVPLSKGVHSPLVAAERKRIEAAGGHVEGGRVCGSLEVSRAFGDARLKRRSRAVGWVGCGFVRGLVPREAGPIPTLSPSAHELYCRLE